MPLQVEPAIKQAQNKQALCNVDIHTAAPMCRLQVEPAIKQALEELQLDYVDLYLVHW